MKFWLQASFKLQKQRSHFEKQSTSKRRKYFIFMKIFRKQKTIAKHGKNMGNMGRG